MFTWAILIAISIVLITPLTFLENLNPIIDVIEDYVDDSGLVRTYYQYFMTPVCWYIFNYVMIPILIELGIIFEGRSRKCHNAKTRMRK